MTEEAAALGPDSIVESIYEERASIAKKEQTLDRFEKILSEMSDEDIEVMLDMADVFLRAAHKRMQRRSRGNNPNQRDVPRPGMPPTAGCKGCGK